MGDRFDAETVPELVRALREGQSRNRHFEEFAGPNGLRARRLHRWLRSLEVDLRRCDVIEARRDGDEIVILLESRPLRLRRTVRVGAALYRDLGTILTLPPVSD